MNELRGCKTIMCYRKSKTVSVLIAPENTDEYPKRRTLDASTPGGAARRRWLPHRCVYRLAGGPGGWASASPTVGRTSRYATHVLWTPRTAANRVLYRTCHSRFERKKKTSSAQVHHRCHRSKSSSPRTACEWCAIFHVPVDRPSSHCSSDPPSPNRSQNRISVSTRLSAVVKT